MKKMLIKMFLILAIFAGYGIAQSPSIEFYISGKIRKVIEEVGDSGISVEEYNELGNNR